MSEPSNMSAIALSDENIVLRRNRFTFDGNGRNRVVGSGGRQTGKFNAVGILREIDFLPGGEEPG